MTALDSEPKPKAEAWTRAEEQASSLAEEWVRYRSRPPGTLREGRILCSSSLILGGLCALVAWTLEQHALSAVSIVQLSLSINFWRQPAYGWRRTLDIGSAMVFSIASCCMSFGCPAPYRTAAPLLYMAACATFLNAARSWLRHRSWVWWHVAFHCVATLGNLTLYVGLRLAPGTPPAARGSYLGQLGALLAISGPAV